MSVDLLLAEDEPLLASVAEDALAEGGFDVTVVHNGADALRQLEADASRFAAVVTDIRLGPGPDGWAIAQRARELLPKMPIVYVSGDKGIEWPAKGVPGSTMLAKPFALAQLVTAVSTLVTEAGMGTLQNEL